MFLKVVQISNFKFLNIIDSQNGGVKKFYPHNVLSPLDVLKKKTELNLIEKTKKITTKHRHHHVLSGQPHNTLDF